MASSSASPLNIYRNDYEIELQMRQIQQEKGDCLTQGHISILPERVHLDLQQNDFTEMVGIWEQWRRAHRDNFQNKYGHIAWLLYVPVDDQMLRAIVQFWDPSYRCFVFNKVDMTPTIEEYSSLLRIDHMQPDKIYWRAQKTGHRRKLAKLLGMTTVEVDKHLKKKGDTECLPWSFLNGYIKKHMEDEQGLLAFAMAIYDLVVFPKVLGHVEVEWPDYKRKEEWVARLRRLMSIEVTWRAPWMPRMQFGSEQFVPMTHQLDQLEFTYGEPETLKRIEEIAQDWKKTCRVDQGRVTDEVTTRYHTWHDQRVKNVIHPPKDPSKHPVNPEPQDVLLESELTRKRLEKEMMNMKRRHEDELEEVKKETARKVRVALKERDEWQSKFEEVSVANSSLLARIQELQSANNALQHEVQRKGQTIQELKNDCDMLETAMEGYKAQYEAIRQEYFQMRERNNSCTQSLQRKEAEMQWILRQMREVAFRARVMADKTEELRREILPKDELSERLISHLKMVRDQYDKNKISEKQILHRYNTRARSKIMGDQHSERMDKIEKKQEEIMGQLSKILELISTDKGKKAAGSSGTPEDVQQTETNTDPVYPPGFTPPPARNASIPMPSVGQYPFFGMPIGPPPTYAQQRPIGGASPSDPISGKIEGGDMTNTRKGGTFKRKEGEAQAITSGQHQGGTYNPYQPYLPYPYYPAVNNTSQSPYPYPPMPNAFPNLYPYNPIQRTLYPTNIHPPTSTTVTASTTQQTTPSNNHTTGESRGWRNKQEKVQFDPIPIPYAELFTQEVYVKRNIREVETSMEKVFEALVKADMLEDCSSFRKEVQRMMDESKIEFYTEASESAVNMISKESTHPMKIKPLTIFYEPKGEFVEDKNRAKMIIEVPKPFPYKDNKAVPWNYNCKVQVSEAKKWIAESQDDAANITGVGGITRSGRCYSPEAFENLKNEKGKEKEQSPRKEKKRRKKCLNVPFDPSSSLTPRYRAGAGLGKELQGIRSPIRTTKNEERFGLGYKPAKKEREEMIAERRKERLARFKGHELEIRGMTYPHLYKTFRSGGCIFPESLTVGNRESVLALGGTFSDLSICATEEGEEQPGNVDEIPTTYLGPPNLKLSSWTTMSLPVTCDSISK
ncbi:Uncharacterized protein TCM_022312 [Theobroma cacao]|uniref:G-patch domain-containing protein n=1 Tax=Theobroma cacao TaxID=3641 RepID=A0A061F0F4_THECC|nr:Uncharacterized protein TCM_022312 [Theobroma cacao]